MFKQTEDSQLNNLVTFYDINIKENGDSVSVVYTDTMSKIMNNEIYISEPHIYSGLVYVKNDILTSQDKKDKDIKSYIESNFIPLGACNFIPLACLQNT